MAIILYKPGEGISIEGILLAWDSPRHHVRYLLNEIYEIADDVTDMSEYHDGDASYNIVQRRDIYKDFRGGDNLFFLNYSTDDLLQEVEVHHGIDISIHGNTIGFSMEIEEVADILSNLTETAPQMSDGEYFFEDLKLLVADGEAMGGEGTLLAYFYCSNHIDHLLNQ